MPAPPPRFFHRERTFEPPLYTHRNEPQGEFTAKSVHLVTVNSRLRGIPHARRAAFKRRGRSIMLRYTYISLFRVWCAATRGREEQSFVSLLWGGGDSVSLRRQIASGTYTTSKVRGFIAGSTFALYIHAPPAKAYSRAFVRSAKRGRELKRQIPTD